MKSFQTNSNYRRLIDWTNDHFPVLLAKMRFHKLFGRRLDLKKPRDLNEKILWLSLFSDTKLWVKCADKYSVRDFVKERGLGQILVKCYGKWDSVQDIEWEQLPQKFVIKTNNGAGTVLIVEDKSKLNIAKVEAMLFEWLTRKISKSTTEFHYREIKPCIIAEELLIPTEFENKISTSVIDYKIWCFNGIPDSFLVCSNRTESGCCLSAYDKDWNCKDEVLVFGHGHEKRTSLVPKPNNIDEMLEVAAKLSAGFPEVRVDLYDINGKIFFGELTFTSFGGTMTYYTQQELLRMGHKIDLTGVKKVR